MSAKESAEAVDFVLRTGLHLQSNVSATAKRKLKNAVQRPAPEIRPARTEMPKNGDQRLGRANLTRGNVAGSHTPGNITPETRLPG
jgi:hypothetical protein